MGAAPLPLVVTTYASSMSSLWTPEGEHRVPRPGEAVPGTPGSPGAGGPGKPGGTQPDPDAARPVGAETAPLSEEELAAERELEEVAKHLAAAPAEDVVANHCYGLFELAAIYLSHTPPMLFQARLAIDGLGALLEGLRGRLGEAEPALHESLSQLRLAFVRLEGAEATGAENSASAGQG